MEEPRGKMPRRAETSESVVPFHSSEASSSEIQQTSTDVSDNPTGERLYLSMTEEGPSGDYKMTMQRDRYGRWMPIRGERTMNHPESKGRRDEASTSRKAWNTEPFRLRRPRQARCMENFISVDGTPTRCLGNTFLPKNECSFRRKYRIHMLKYIIHMCTKTCLRQGLTRAFCAVWICGYEVLSLAGTDSRTRAEGRPARVPGASQRLAGNLYQMHREAELH